MSILDSKNVRIQMFIRHGVYLLLAFLICYRGWFGNGLILGGGDQPDWTGTAWAYWWTGYAITNGINPFDGQWNFYPIGQRPLAQYNLLELLYENSGNVVSREAVVTAVWSNEESEGVSEQAIDALARRLRERIAEIDSDNKYLETVRGHGFRLNLTEK